jgi:large subunit ribosomal protein L6
MSRVANKPIPIPKGVQVTLAEGSVSVKGPKGGSTLAVPTSVGVEQSDGTLRIVQHSEEYGANALAGTTRALLANMCHGVSSGFERKLTLVGVGYRAAAKGKTLGLTLGFSHPIEYPVPEGITIDTPSQTEIVVKGVDKQLVGQVAADIRAFRPPEVYKGKGVRYADEQVVIKESKKK